MILLSVQTKDGRVSTVTIGGDARRRTRDRLELQRFDAAVQAQMDGEMSAGELENLLKAAERRMGACR